MDSTASGQKPQKMLSFDKASLLFMSIAYFERVLSPDSSNSVPVLVISYTQKDSMANESDDEDDSEGSGNDSAGSQGQGKK